MKYAPVETRNRSHGSENYPREHGSDGCAWGRPGALVLRAIGKISSYESGAKNLFAPTAPKRGPFYLILFALVVCLVGCSSTENHLKHSQRPLRILPVGDSITAGYTDNPSWRVPFEFGYRGPLFQMLRSNGIPVQFVGNCAEPWNGLWKVPTNQPTPDLRALGQDHHEGHGAKATAFVAAHIGEWIETNQPDVVLLMIGINDIAAGSTNAPPSALTNLRAIVETIAQMRPATHVIVAQTIPYTRPTPAILELNRFIRETLVPDFAARGVKISTVNQFANFVSDPNSSAGDRSLYANGYNHPNAEGYRRMAETWFKEIQNIIK
jgi:lysophospholipase L1-like esterase